MYKKLDAQFPARRICRAQIITKDGQSYLFRRITGPVLSNTGQEKLIDMITGKDNMPIRSVVQEVNQKEYWLDIKD